MHAATHATYIATLARSFRRGQFADDLAMPVCFSCDKVEQPNATKVFYYPFIFQVCAKLDLEPRNCVSAPGARLSSTVTKK